VDMLRSAESTVAIATIVGALAGCLSSPPFRCENAAQCGGGANRCINELCAEPSAACAGTGFRYMDGSGTLSLTCVPGDSVGDQTPDAMADASPDSPPPAAFRRDVCIEGPAMPTKADPCVDAVCGVEARCCSLGWTDDCVQRASRMCPALPTGARRCRAAVSASGNRRFGVVVHDGVNLTEVRTLQCLTPFDPGAAVLVAGALAWADREGDGIVDLAAATFDTVHFYPGLPRTADRHLNLDGPRIVIRKSGNPDLILVDALAWGDADGDGDLELAHRDDWNGVDVISADDNVLKYLTEVPIATPPGRTEAGVAWVQGDGDRPLELVTTFGNEIRLYDYQGTWKLADTFMVAGARFSRAKARWSFVAITGDRGVVLEARDGKLLLRGSAPAGFDIAWAYIDPDDDADLVAVADSGATVWRAQGNDWGPLPSLPADPPTGGVSVGVGDIDGDGDIDIVTQPIDSAHRILRNDSTSEKVAFRVIQSPTDINGAGALLIETELVGVPADIAPVSGDGCPAP